MAASGRTGINQLMLLASKPNGITIWLLGEKESTEPIVNACFSRLLVAIALDDLLYDDR